MGYSGCFLPTLPSSWFSIFARDSTENGPIKQVSYRQASREGPEETGVTGSSIDARPRGTPPVSLLVGTESEPLGQARSVLARVGFEAQAASTGQKALETCDRTHIDLLVLNPPLSDDPTGLESARAIKGRHPDISVLVIAERDPDTEREYEEFGAWLLETPLNTHLLGNCAQSLMRQKLFQVRVRELQEEAREVVQVDHLWFKVFNRLRRGKQ